MYVASVTPFRAVSDRRQSVIGVLDPGSHDFAESSTVMATGLNTKVALEIAAVMSVHLICTRSSTFSVRK